MKPLKNMKVIHAALLMGLMSSPMSARMAKEYARRDTNSLSGLGSGRTTQSTQQRDSASKNQIDPALA